MSKAIALQTFHHSAGIVYAGQEFDSGDPFVEQFAPMFSRSVEENPEASEDPKEPHYMDGYEEQSIGVLRSLAKQRKLDTSGTKEDLVGRLRKADAE